MPSRPTAVVAMDGRDNGESLVSLHGVLTKGGDAWQELGGKRWIPAAGPLFHPASWVAKKRKLTAVGRSKLRTQLPIFLVSEQLKGTDAH